MISGITKGEELKKIKNGRPGILGILTKEYPIITPNKVAKVADKDAIFILVEQMWFSEIKFKSEKEDAYIYLPIWIITVSIIFFGIYSSPIIEFSNLSADYLISGYQN